MHRRKYLALTGVSLLGAIAGCSGDDGDSDGEDNESADGEDGDEPEPADSGDGGDSTDDSSDGSDSTDDTSDGDDSTDSTSDGDDSTDDTADGGDGLGGSDLSRVQAVVVDYYEINNEFTTGESSQSATADAFRDIIHSDSPLLEFITNTMESGDTEDTPAEVTSLSTEVTNRDLSQSELNENFLFNVGELNVSEETVAAIAGDNAVVDATVERVDQDPDVTEEITWLVVPENSEPKLFINISTTTRGGGSS